VATGCRGLRLHPAVGEGCRRWRGTGSSNPSPSSGESPANLISSIMVGVDARSQFNRGPSPQVNALVLSLPETFDSAMLASQTTGMWNID
jgi:hypothetical protein